VTATLELALRASGLDDAEVDRRPRLLSDNGPSYIASDLSNWLEEQGMRHTRGKPYHPMTQGKIERWHLSLKSRILPADLERAVAGFVDPYNHRRYHESLDNITPAAVYFGRGTRILKRHQEIKRRTIEHRHRQQHQRSSMSSNHMGRTLSWLSRSTVPKTVTTDRLYASLRPAQTLDTSGRVLT
jgi:putative transposase